MKSLLEWVIGIAVVGLVVIYPLALAYSIYEGIKNQDKGTRRSYKSGWFNEKWK